MLKRRVRNLGWALRVLVFALALSLLFTRPTIAGTVLFQDNFEGYQEVFDGTTAGVDKSLNDGSLTSLSANWSAYTDSESGLSRYDYSIGTTPGGTDIKAWTSNTTSTSVTATGLTLQTGVLYYTNVRAVDVVGNVSDAASSDGQMVAPSLSFGISPSSQTFATLNQANSYTDTKTTTLTTSTNAYGGYKVYAYATGLPQSGAVTIPAFNGGSYASPDTWNSGDTGFGYTSSDTSVQGSNIFQVNPCPGGTALASPGCYAPYSQSAPGDIVADHASGVTTAISGEQFTITNRITVGATQQPATYGTTLAYQVLATY